MNNAWEKIHTNTEVKNQFLRKKWFDSWAVYNDNDNNWQKEINYLHIAAGDGHDAIIPYAIQKQGPFKFASLVGNFLPHRGIPNTGADCELINLAAQKISEIGNAEGFRFGFVEDNDRFIAPLLEELKRRKWKFVTKSYGHNYGRPLPTTEEEYSNSIRGNQRRNVARRRRQLEALGKVEIKCFTKESQQGWEAAFNDVANVEEKSWVAERGEPKVMGNENQKFWNGLVKDEWFGQAIKIFILYLDDEPISYTLVIDTAEMRYGFAKAFDKKMAKYGTGALLEIELMSNGIENGLKFLNSSIGSEEHKMTSGDDKLAQLIDLVAFPPTIKGRTAYFIVKMKYFVDSLNFKGRWNGLKRKIKSKNNRKS